MPSSCFFCCWAPSPRFYSSAAGTASSRKGGIRSNRSFPGAQGAEVRDAVPAWLAAFCQRGTEESSFFRGKEGAWGGKGNPPSPAQAVIVNDLLLMRELSHSPELPGLFGGKGLLRDCGSLVSTPSLNEIIRCWVGTPLAAQVR